MEKIRDNTSKKFQLKNVCNFENSRRISSWDALKTLHTKFYFFVILHAPNFTSIVICGPNFTSFESFVRSTQFNTPFLSFLSHAHTLFPTKTSFNQALSNLSFNTLGMSQILIIQCFVKRLCFVCYEKVDEQWNCPQECHKHSFYFY